MTDTIKNHPDYVNARDTAADKLKDEFLRSFVVMYMASRQDEAEDDLKFLNSGIAPLKVAQHHMRKLSDADTTLTYTVYIGTQHNAEHIKAYWSDALDIEPNVIILNTEVSDEELADYEGEHGVVALRVVDARFRRQLEAWMDHVREQWRSGFSSRQAE